VLETFGFDSPGEPQEQCGCRTGRAPIRWPNPGAHHPSFQGDQFEGIVLICEMGGFESQYRGRGIVVHVESGGFRFQVEAVQHQFAEPHQGQIVDGDSQTGSQLNLTVSPGQLGEELIQLASARVEFDLEVEAVGDGQQFAVASQ